MMTSTSEFRSQLDLSATVNQWSQVTKLQMLLRLKGPALRAFHAIPADERRTYAKAIHALQIRFSPVDRHDQSVHRAALRSHRRKPDEDLFEIAAADSVLLLTDRAYPSLDSEALDQLEL